MSLRVLIACERFGVVRDAFLARGHDAWSLDLVPCATGSNRHITGDVRDHLNDGWDLLMVAHPPCFIADTLVLTKGGHRRICDVAVGDEVLTHKGRWRRVTEVTSKTTGTLTKIKSTNGLATFTTAEHPYFVRYREPYRNGYRTKLERDAPPTFIPAGHLTSRHFTASVLPPEEHIAIHDDDLWLMGRYVADGWLRESRWTQGKLEEMVIAVGPSKLDEFETRVTRKVAFSDGGTTIKAHFYGHEAIAPFLQFGRGAENKALPAWVMALPAYQAKVFLGGYLSGDGYVRQKGVSASTVSPRLALGIAVLMQRVFRKCPALRTSQPRARVVIEGREVDTMPLHHVEVPQSATRLRNYTDESYAWGHVRAVTTVNRTDRVFNLSVEEDETYTANGLVVHNCTRLCNSGVRWLSVPPKGRNLSAMWADLDAGADLFSACWNAPIPRIAVENPVMHKYAKDRIRNYAAPSQTVQPWHFGDPAFKATSLYLRGLPLLQPTNRLTPPAPGSDQHKTWSVIHRMSPGPNRAMARSRTFPGIAAAMAEQWGGAVTSTTMREML